MQQKDKPFPRYARDYFEQLLEQYTLLLEDQPKKEPPSAIVDLIAKAKSTPAEIHWADVFALETAYLYAVPDERLAGELELARDRYRSIVGNDAYADYLKTAPAVPAPPVPPTAAYYTALRAELLTLAERIRYIYTFVPPKEAQRNRLAIGAGISTIAAALVGLAIYGILRFAFGTTVATILVVMFVGQMGGFISVQQRLNNSAGVDPLFKELQLSNGWFSIVVISPLSGAIFAIILYFMFVGGLMTGGLFPRFGPSPAPTYAPATAAPGAAPRSAVTPSPAPAPAPTPCPVTAYCSPLDVTQFLERAAPTAIEDWGKLLVWAFIAGFAERFVPDVLSRLTGAQYSVGGDKPTGGRPVPVSSNADPNADEREPEPHAKSLPTPQPKPEPQHDPKPPEPTPPEPTPPEAEPPEAKPGGDGAGDGTRGG